MSIPTGETTPQALGSRAPISCSTAGPRDPAAGERPGSKGPRGGCRCPVRVQSSCRCGSTPAPRKHRCWWVLAEEGTEVAR